MAAVDELEVDSLTLVPIGVGMSVSVRRYDMAVLPISRVTAEQAGNFFRETRAVNSTDALQLGLVSEVKDAGITAGADIISLVLT